MGRGEPQGEDEVEEEGGEGGKEEEGRRDGVQAVAI